MNVFEDLIDELKEENLLEETVIETHKSAAEDFGPLSPANENSAKNESINFQASPANGAAPPSAAELNAGSELSELDSTPLEQVPTNLEQQAAQPANDDYRAAARAARSHPCQQPAPVNDREFYRKRAIDEVSSLQMVDLVLTGIEREQMKTAPTPYDELEVKKALHVFLQSTQDVNSTAYAEAEFQLMQETETWYSALSQRDSRISLAYLRRFCETTKPVLSSQALVSLARFYRNSPYSEFVRSKFDLVLTRLFSRDAEDEKRELLFSRDEVILQINDIYTNWGSIDLYSPDKDESEILIITLKFEDLLNEIEAAGSIDELIRTDFFPRLRKLKESTKEDFFSPLVAATAVEINVKVGNRYVELLRKEAENSSVAEITEKYGFSHDQAISEIIGKTLQIYEVFKPKVVKPEPEAKQEEQPAEVRAVREPDLSATTEKMTRRRLFAINKWLLLVTLLLVAGNGGLYVWAEYNTGSTEVTANVQKVNLDNSSLKDYVRNARISEETFYGVTLPAWDGLNREKRQEMLEKIMSIGAEKGFRKVHLVTAEGHTVGFASRDRTEVY